MEVVASVAITSIVFAMRSHFFVNKLKIQKFISCSKEKDFIARFDWPNGDHLGAECPSASFRGSTVVTLSVKICKFDCASFREIRRFTFAFAPSGDGIGVIYVVFSIVSWIVAKVVHRARSSMAANVFNDGRHVCSSLRKRRMGKYEDTALNFAANYRPYYSMFGIPTTHFVSMIY